MNQIMTIRYVLYRNSKRYESNFDHKDMYHIMVVKLESNRDNKACIISW